MRIFAKRLESAHGGIIFAVLTLLNSTWIFYVYLSMARIGAFHPASLARILEGTGERPYIYRALTTLLAKRFAPLIPPGLVDWFSSAPPAIQGTFERLSRGGYSREAAFALVFMFLSLVGFGIAEKTFLADLGLRKKGQIVLPLVIQMFILPVNFYAGYYYDLPQLLLMTLSLIYLHRQNWPGYFAALAIASLNKETSIFLVPVYSIYYWTRLPRGKFVSLLAGQLTIWGAIRISLMVWFWNNPGSAIWFTLPAQIDKYVEHPFALVFTVGYFAFVIFLVRRRWDEKNEFLRAASVIGIITLILFFTSGSPLEFRVFLDALPALAILIFPPAHQREITPEPLQSIDKPSRTA